jgi:type IX secretion system PorP/SprF family membrane protein
MTRGRTYHLCIAIALLLCLSGTAQHSTLISQYMFNGVLINPAYAGAKNSLAVNINYRNQWTGFKGAPTTQLASIHSPIKRKPISIGGMVARDEVGVSTEVSLRGLVSYKVKMKEGFLRFGLGAGLANTNSRWSEVLIEEGGDPLFQTDVTGLIRPLFSAGMYYDSKSWYMGYSMPSIMRYEYPGQEEVRSTFSLGKIEHILTAGYAYKHSRSLVIKPSFLLRTIPSTGAQLDINCNLIFSNRLWTGASYRHNEAIVAMMEYQVHHQFRIGYAYDYNLGPIGSYSAGSHELMLLWVFRMQSFARNPRYF